MTRQVSRCFIVPAKSDDMETVLQIYVESFYDREPLTACLGLSKKRMAAIGKAMHGSESGEAFARQLCFLAKDPGAAGKSAGFIVCDDPADPNAERLPPNLSKQEKRILPAVAALLEAVRAPLGAEIGKRLGETLHVAALGVASGYEGKGLATSLLQAALLEARTRGYRHAFAECTNPASRACHEKCGFSTLNHVLGDEFVHDGIRPFAGRGLSIYLMRKPLSP